MREDALDWVKQQEDRLERRARILMVATIAAAVGAWIYLACSNCSFVIVGASTTAPVGTYQPIRH